MENIRTVTPDYFIKNIAEVSDFLKENRNNLIAISKGGQNRLIVLDYEAFYEVYGAAYETVTIDDFISD